MEEISNLQLHQKIFVLDILDFMVRKPFYWYGNLEKGEYNQITQFCCLNDSEWGGKGKYIKFSPERLVLTFALDNIRKYYYNNEEYLTNFLKDYYNKVHTHFIKLQNELEASEEYKMRMEQQKMQQEEETMRRLMELEKKMEEQKIKKKEKIPCSVCGLLISKNHMAVHKKSNKCINFGKNKQGEEDIALLDGVETTFSSEDTNKIPKYSFKCDCGMILTKSNKSNHQNTKKCQRKRGLIE